MHVNSDSTLSHFVQPLAKQEPDLWLAAGTLPQGLRAQWLGLLAARAQWQQIPTQVSEPMLGHIRLAWWRELVQELKAGQVAKPHPLKDVLAEWAATPEAAPLLEQLLDTIGATLETEATLAAGEAMMREFALPFEAMMHKLGAGAESAEAAELLAQGWAWLHILREMPLRLRDDGLPLPQEWLNAYGLSKEPQDYADGKTLDALREALARFLQTEWLPEWRSKITATHLPAPMAQQFIRIHALIADFYLRRAAKNPAALTGTALLEPSRVVLPLKLLIA